MFCVKVVSVQLADNDMDNYVLAVAKKKTAIRMMKELSDIVSIVNTDNYSVLCVYACACVCIKDVAIYQYTNEVSLYQYNLYVCQKAYTSDLEDEPVVNGIKLLVYLQLLQNNCLINQNLHFTPLIYIY